MRRQTQALARLGYFAVATDMYGGGLYHSNPDDAGQTLGLLLENRALLRARARAWYAQIASLPNVDPRRIAAIGYCFGGLCVLELARTGADLKLVVSYHGLLDTTVPAQAGAIKGLVCVYTGAKDPYAPPEQVEALRQELSAAQARWQITVFGDAAHGFTDPDAGATQRPGIAYDALAEKLSWAGTVAALHAQL